ncbi:MAG: N-acetylglucosamine-6-phosphate deacetylase [Clostridiales bacterium]|nr:N-acetylglucosamine-6-phosphate deacetylase [Clostridiales bacterium]
MRLNHVDLIGPDFDVKKDMSILVEGQRISAMGRDLPSDHEGEEYDLEGLTIFPGFIDLHIHGAAGADTSDGSVEALTRISSFLSRKGVTSFCPTTMMISKERLCRVFSSYEQAREGRCTGARFLGLRMEGPFLSKEKCGVQNTDYAELPSKEFIEDLVRRFSPEDLSIIDISPELPGAMTLIREMKNDFVFSAAHTAATFSCCKEAISEGLHHATHLFNAMNPLHHHEPGAVGALLDDASVTCELICDGMHVHPAVLRFAITVLGEDRLVVVSDAMRASGMPDGEYDLGGKSVIVRDGRTDMGDGRLAGSTTNIHDEFKYLLALGVPLRTALRACTINPARVLHIDRDTGSLEVGKFADMVAMDDQYRIRKVWVQGRLVFDADTADEGAGES